MSNIYEALQQAQREKKGAWPPAAEREDAPERHAHGGLPAPTAKPELCSLYNHVEHLLPATPRKIIQFVGCREGEGVSTVAGGYAEAAVARFGRRVLIVDAAHRNPTQHVQFGALRRGNGPKDGIGDHLGGMLLEAGTNLFLLPAAAPSSFLLRNPAEAIGMFRTLLESFDLIVVDSSPVTTSPETLALAGYCDGVILVIEADRTKWQMAESAKEKIIRHGGTVLGVVLNRRRLHIPECIYKRL